MYKDSLKVLQLISQKTSDMNTYNQFTISEISAKLNLNQDSIRRVIEDLKENDYVKLDTKESVSFTMTDEGKSYYSSGFPDLSLYKKAGSLINDLSAAEKSSLRWAKQKGHVNIDGGKIVALKPEQSVISELNDLKNALSLLSSGKEANLDLQEELLQRKLIEKKFVKNIFIKYTGKQFDSSISNDFDVSVESSNAPVGKAHPISVMSNRMCTIMSEMGFSQMQGDIVESSFWNFDALFQPQDHPAREMADTFYVSGDYPLPEDKKLVDRVSASHEKGWKYKWSPKEAAKRVLRTHTTCLSARYLSQIKDKKPHKYFAIGRVFRNEATDYKHLAEFHQVEGIIAWEGAKFTDLLGTLKEFYSKLGFDQVRFRPSFFPYTEPSLEVDVYFEPKKQWMEIGGAGVFRPEVSIPLCGVYPVLAWGLSLERPLMMMLNLDDIRTFYRNDMEFLKSSRLDV
ncbi:MAG: phenylalanine--tRNA ligase subunit alpha [Candidatus Bilamarchaeum sp.]|jgi:phenylalanyl-tRNA synthetase alpha chain